jgi:hypothetical protein
MIMVHPNSPLLVLPAELRNRIYEYVFAEPNKILRCTGDKSNKLKTVCRQLKQETEDLEFRCNKIVTLVGEYIGPLQPAEQFVTFAQNVSTQALNCLSTVILKSDCEDLPALNPGYFSQTRPWHDLTKHFRQPATCPNSLIALARICRAHPRIQIKYILPGFFLGATRRYAALHFILQGVFYTYAMCQERRDQPKLEDIPACLKAEIHLFVGARQWLKIRPPPTAKQIERELATLHASETRWTAREIRILEIGTQEGIGKRQMWDEAPKLYRASNLKFFPTCTSFDAAAFKQLIFDARTSSSFAATIANDMVAMDLVDAWTAEARRWVEEGI